MAILKNVKHERFVLAIARGEPAEKAYAEAGFKTATTAVAASAASRLLKNVKVAARLSEIRGQVATHVVKRTAINELWVRNQAVKVYQRCMSRKSFHPSGAIGALRVIGDELGMFDPRRFRIPPPGVNVPIGDDPATSRQVTVNNTQVNVALAAVEQGGIEAVRAYLAILRGEPA